MSSLPHAFCLNQACSLNQKFPDIQYQQHRSGCFLCASHNEDENLVASSCDGDFSCEGIIPSFQQKISFYLILEHWFNGVKLTRVFYQFIHYIKAQTRNSNGIWVKNLSRGMKGDEFSPYRSLPTTFTFRQKPSFLITFPVILPPDDFSVVPSSSLPQVPLGLGWWQWQVS